MKNQTAIHSILILTSVFLAFVFSNHEILANYSLQLTAILVIVFIITNRMHKPSIFRLVESVISILGVLTIVSATGGLKSPFFFLNYFLLFEMSLFLAPSVSIILTLALCLFFLYSQNTINISGIAVILSFLFMSPLAYYLGNIYNRYLNQNNQISTLSEKVRELEWELVS